MLTQPENNDENKEPYTLYPGEHCWINIKDVSIHIQHHNEVFSFDIYNNTTNDIIEEHYFHFPTEQ